MRETSAERPDPGSAAEPDPAPSDQAPKKRRASAAQTMGGVLFGFEQQVWRTAPPPHELVHHARPDSPVPAGDGSMLTFVLPDGVELAEDSWCGPDGVCVPTTRDDPDHVDRAADDEACADDAPTADDAETVP